MKCYQVQMMTKGNYLNYLSGSWNYYIENVQVVADDVSKAIEKAKLLYPNYEINPYSIVECNPDPDLIDQMTFYDL